MGLFDKFRKKEDFVDLTNRDIVVKKKVTQNVSENKTSESASPFSFLGNLANAGSDSDKNSNNSESGYVNLSSVENPKERLKQRLLNMTEQIEDLNNQVYRLQQRIDLLEQKLKVRGDYLG